MVDQVTFPPSIGGSGNTYTNDANPETGMYGGAHRKNFFPIQADMVAAAGYVSQYAQAIDGAKANADRAEDAKGYVEAVADAYKVNLLDQFKRKATLGLEFIEGRYWRDDGERLETNDPNQIVNFERNTSKWEEGPSGVIREVAPNVLAREWRGGLPQGVSINESRTNLILASGDLTDPAWIKFGGSPEAGVTLGPEISPIDDVYYSRYEVASDAYFTMLIYQSFQLTQDERCVFSFFVSKNYNNLRYIQIDTGSNNRSVFDIETGSFVLTHNVVTWVEVDDVGGGWRVKVSFITSDSTVRCGVLPRYNSSVSYNVDYFAGDYVDVTGFQLEIESNVATSYIPTTTTAVTRSADALSVLLEGELNFSLGTLYTECYVEAARSFSGAGNIFGMYKDGSNYWQLSQTSFSAVRLYVVIDGAAEIYTTPGYSGSVSRKYIATYRNGILNIYINGVSVFSEIPIGEEANKINLSGIYASPANSSPAIKRAKSVYYLPSWTGSVEAQELTTQ